MESTDIVLELDLIQTGAVALAVLFLGYLLKRFIPALKTYNIPEPVVGGIVFALGSGIAYSSFGVALSFDMTLKTPLMLVFFTTVGLGASVKLLTRGGPKVFLFLLVASGLLLVQNATGVALAFLTDLNPLQGLVTSSITLSGGHGTGATYADIFASVDNLQGVLELAMASATFGLVLGGIIGGPVTKRLVERYGLHPTQECPPPAVHEVTYDPEELDRVTPRRMLETLFIIVLCMAVGIWTYDLMRKAGIALPSFIASLLLGVVVANALEMSRLYKINKETLDQWGTMSLSIFLAMALMSLRLWELLALAGPMLLILVAQTAVMTLYAYFVTFKAMGGDYDAAIIAGGHCGFGLGATPTAVANMEALVSRYGASPTAFLVVPMVGAFFIDITNALVIQLFLALPFVS